MTKIRTPRLMFAAAIVASLGFGATQALAAPDGGARKAQICAATACNNLCVSMGYTCGRCVNGKCLCYTDC